MADTTKKLTQLKYIQRVIGKDSKGQMKLEPMIVGANAYIYTNKNILLTDAKPENSFGTNSAYIGTNVSGSGNNSAYIGTNVSGSGNNSIYLGTGIKGAKANQLIIGQYNESTDKAFVIGNGTDKQPSDAFTVATNGDIESSGNLTVKGITSKGALTVTGEFAVQNQNGAKWLTIQPPTMGASVASATLSNLTSIDMIASDTLNLEAETITISGSKPLELSNLDSLTVVGATLLKNGATVTGGSLVIQDKYSLQTPIIRALGEVLTIQGSASEQLMHFKNGVIWCDNTLGILGKVRGNEAADDIQFSGGIKAEGKGTFKQLSITDTSTFDGLITASGGLKVQKSILTDGLTNTDTTFLAGKLTAHAGIDTTTLTAMYGVSIHGDAQMYGGVHTNTIAALDSDNISMSNQVTFTKPIIAQEAVTIGTLSNRMNLTTYGMIAVRHKEDLKNSVETLTFMVDEDNTTVSNTLIVGSTVKGGEAEVRVHGEVTTRTLHLTGETAEGGRIKVDYTQNGEIQTQVINLLKLFRDVETIKANLGLVQNI